MVFRCCECGYTELLSSLIQHGGEPETLNSVGDSPLHLAVANKNYPAVRVLLSAGNLFHLISYFLFISKIC